MSLACTPLLPSLARVTGGEARLYSSAAGHCHRVLGIGFVAAPFQPFTCLSLFYVTNDHGDRAVKEVMSITRFAGSGVMAVQLAKVPLQAHRDPCCKAVLQFPLTLVREPGL